MSATIRTCSSDTPAGTGYVDVSANGTRTILGLGPVDEVAEDPSTTAETLPVAALATEAARAARGDARDEHAIADLHVLDAGSDLLDGADRFVTEDATIGDLGHVAFEDVQVSAADRDRVDADDRVGVGDDRRCPERLPRPCDRDRDTRVPSWRLHSSFRSSALRAHPRVRALHVRSSTNARASGISSVCASSSSK